MRLSDALGQEELERVSKFLEDLDKEEIEAESDGLYIGGQHELSTIEGIEIDPEQLDRLQERAQRFASGLTEAASRKRSPALREAFSYYVAHVLRGEDTPESADRVLRLAFLELGNIPASKVTEILQWITAVEDQLSLQEVVSFAAGHDFYTEECAVVFNDAFYEGIRLHLRKEVDRFLDAVRRGPVRMQARAKIGDQYASKQVRRFMNQACRDFGVKTEIFEKHSVKWVADEVAITVNGIKAIGGVKVLDRGFMSLGEKLEAWGVCPRYTNLLVRSIGELSERADWSAVQLLTRLDILTEIHRAQPAQRHARKQAFADKRNATQQKGRSVPVPQGANTKALTPFERACNIASQYDDNEFVAVEEESQPFEKTKAYFVEGEHGILAVEPKGSIWRYVFLVRSIEVESKDDFIHGKKDSNDEAGTQMTDGCSGWVGGLAPLSERLSNLKQVKICRLISQ